MKVRHSFTHFHLYLKVYKANSFPPFEEGFWVKQEDFHHYALPTLMKKVLKEIKGIF